MSHIFVLILGCIPSPIDSIDTLLGINKHFNRCNMALNTWDIKQFHKGFTFSLVIKAEPRLFLFTGRISLHPPCSKLTMHFFSSYFYCEKQQAKRRVQNLTFESDILKPAKTLQVIKCSVGANFGKN